MAVTEETLCESC